MHVQINHHINLVQCGLLLLLEGSDFSIDGAQPLLQQLLLLGQRLL